MKVSENDKIKASAETNMLYFFQTLSKYTIYFSNRQKE